MTTRADPAALRATALAVLDEATQLLDRYEQVGYVDENVMPVFLRAAATLAEQALAMADEYERHTVFVAEIQAIWKTLIDAGLLPDLADMVCVGQSPITTSLPGPAVGEREEA